VSESGTPPQLRREYPDPYEAKNPIPALYLVFFGAVAAVGFSYLIQHKGDDLALAGDERSSQASAAPAERSGAALYQATCAACHQPTGAGVPGAFPPLISSPWLLDDPETPIRIVLLGVQGKLQVAGHTYDGAMPPFGKQLNDGEIARILTHARSAWGNQAAAIPEADVRRVRASLGTRTQSWQGGAELTAARAARSP
jgi:mono/diheme cytochrome c family protein